MTILALLLGCTPSTQPKDSGAADTAYTADTADTDTGGDSDSGGETGKSVDLVLYSSGGGGGAATAFVGEYVEENCPTTCDPNTAPTLEEPTVYVNGVATSSPAPHVGDRVAVAIAYADAECNLACGAQYYSWSSPRASEASGGSLPSNLPCDTATGGVWLGFDFGAVEAGEYTWSLHVEDACAGESARPSGSFTVGK